MLQFLRRRDDAEIHHVRLLRSEVAEALRCRLDLGGDAVIRVTEVGCADPDCPDVEIIAVLLRPGRPSQAVKVAKPMLDLAPSDFDDLAARLAAKCADLATARR